MKQLLTEDEKKKFEQWVIENVTDAVVPIDEGNSGALIFNLVHLIRGDREKYSYKPEQDREINTWLS